MSDYVIETSKTIETDAGTFRLQVLADPHNDVNPRKDSDVHLGVMTVVQSGHNLPREGKEQRLGWDVEDAVQDHGFQTVARWLRIFHGATVVLPIYSGGGGSEFRLIVGLRGDDAEAGNYLGVIYDTPETRAKGWGEETPARDVVERDLRAEVEQYDTWANGEMTMWIVERQTVPGDPDACDGSCTYGCGSHNDGEWEIVDSCGGYFSTEEAREVGMPELERCAAESQAERVEELHAQALIENERRGWTVARQSAERAVAVLRQYRPDQLDGIAVGDCGAGTEGLKALEDLIADLLHLAYLNGTHPDRVTRQAGNRWFAEVADEDIETAAEAAEAGQAYA